MKFFEFLKAVLIGIVEGITEWLPISSTGHMILLDELVKLSVSAEFLSLFLVVIQLGAICAVPVFFFEKLNPFSKKKSASEKKATWDLFAKVIVGVLPAAVLGLLLDDFLDAHLGDSQELYSASRRRCQGRYCPRCQALQRDRSRLCP